MFAESAALAVARVALKMRLKENKNQTPELNFEEMKDVTPKKHPKTQKPPKN